MASAHWRSEIPKRRDRCWSVDAKSDTLEAVRMKFKDVASSPSEEGPLAGAPIRISPNGG